MKIPVLEARNLNKNFGGLKALRELSFTLAKGRIKSFMGPNGAGKTTLFDIISGLESADSGNIYYKGAEITKMPAEKRARIGISRTFQTNQVFERLNVVENIMVGCYTKTKVRFISAGLWLPSIYGEEHASMRKAFDILAFLGMYDKADRRVSQVSYLERKLIELGRTIAMKPDLLLLDEPFGGLNLKEMKELSEKIGLLRDKGISIAIIDHHFDLISDISDEVVVLSHGEIIAGGTPSDISMDKRVISEYFGVRDVISQ